MASLSLTQKLLSADTRDIMSLAVTGLLIAGSVMRLFDAEKVLLIIGMVFAYWFGQKRSNGT